MRIVTMSASSLILRRHILVLKKTWLNSFFWAVLEPLVYLGAIGFGLGAYIANIGDRPFVEFYFPGLLCASVMFTAYSESSFGTYSKWMQIKIFKSIQYAPISAHDILIAEVKIAMLKAMCGLVGISAVSSLFGLIDLGKFVYALPIFLVLAAAFSAFGLLICSFAKSYNSFVFSTSGIIVPLSLISGIYFPIESMPYGMQFLAYAFPLAHATALVKMIFWSESPSTWWQHTGMLIIFTVGVFIWSFSRMKKKLESTTSV